MNDNVPTSSRTIKLVASRLGVDEESIKKWLRTNRMLPDQNGVLTIEQYKAIMDHFGRDGFERDRVGGPVFHGSSKTDYIQNSRMATPDDDITILNPNLSMEKDVTILNPSLKIVHQEADVDATVLNPSAQRAIEQYDSDVTLLNTFVRVSETYLAGDLIGNKYKVISSYDNHSGEADLYLCEMHGTNYIAKVYRRPESIKDEIWPLLKAINSPYVVIPIERLSFDGQTVEILPYYKRGSLSSTRLNLEQIRRVVFCVNEGLHALHAVGIIHKDIKPSNLIWADNGEDVLIIDFGISSLLDENRTLKVTSTGLTLQYAAPETLHNIFSNYSDYYALGVTVYELFTGSTPYSNMALEEIERYYSIQNIPIPEEMPEEVRDLILGTTYFDIRNRKDTDNPNCRWCYEQVKKWCDGKSQTVPGHGDSGFGAMLEYSFSGQTFQNRISLVKQLCAQWEEGKEELGSGRLIRHFQQIDKTTGNELAALMKEPLDDILYMRALHAIDHGSFAFMWKGRYYQDIKEFAFSTQEELNNKDNSMQNYLEEAMVYHAFSEHIKLVFPQRSELSNHVREIEDYFIKQSADRRERAVYDYVMLYRLMGKPRLIINGEEFDNTQGLTNHLLQLRLKSEIEFESFCHELIDYQNNLSAQFEAWIIANGKQDTLREWKKTIMIEKE